MWICQLFGGVYTSEIFDGCMSVKYLGGLHLLNICRMYVRQMFGGSTPGKIFDGRLSVKYLGGLHLQDI